MAGYLQQRRKSVLPKGILLIAVVLFLGAMTWFLLLPQVWFASYEPKEGDVLFQSLPRQALSIAIEGATDSPWSHCGIVARENGQWFVYEAYGHVQRVPLREFWHRSRRNRLAVYRWRERERQHVSGLLAQVRLQMGLPYDSRYEMDDEKIYCSELIYKAFLAVTGRPLGELVRLGDLNWQPHQALIEKLEGGPVPLDRMMITPRHLASAPELQLLHSHGVD